MKYDQKRLSGVTVYGAIVQGSTRFHYMCCDEGGTSNVNTLAFLKKLKKELGRRQWNKSVLVWDNAKGHKGDAIKGFIQQNPGITLMPLPTASSVLNNVERVWAILRREFTRELFESHTLDGRSI